MTDLYKAATFSDDFLDGGPAIQRFTQIPKRKLHYLLSKGYLPGTFKIGNRWCGLKSEILNGLRSKAAA